MTLARRQTVGVVLIIVGVVVALDQLTKAIMIRAIGPDADRSTIEIIPGVLQFRFVRNSGGSFGMFQGQSSIIAILATGAVAFLVFYYFRHGRNDWTIGVAIGLQVGGAIGNLIDRFRFGYVVDFIDFPRFPTFNVADSAITVGVTLLIYALLFRTGPGSPVEHESQFQRSGDDP